MDADRHIAGEPETAEMVELLLDLADRIRAHSESVSVGFDLSVPQATALLSLERPIPMNELATALRCDASNVTGIVDRLEDRGLVERHMDQADRRVKQLVLTQAGRELRSELHQQLCSDLPTAADLTVGLRRLGDLLREMQAHA